ncbi:MAG: class I SAM-dependent methyltransferase [Oceanicaulis sp.]
MKTLWTTAALAALMIAACAPDAEDNDAPAIDTMGEEESAADTMMDGEGESASDEMADDAMAGGDRSGDTAMDASASDMDAVLADARRDGDRARDEFRNPGETLAFFGIEPDDTVAEALPGGGWYTRVILPYVAEEGRYVALNYAMDQWEEMYGDRWTEETAAQMESWPQTAPEALAENGPVSADAIDAYMLGSIPDSEDGEADVVLFIRAVHHMMKFETDYLATALEDVHAFLKPGGVVGVVQHRAPEDMDAEMTTGSRGYVKQSDVVAAFEAAGFVLDGESDINANPADTADHEQGVWGMGPSNAGDTEEEDAPPSQDLGESDRMTLRFVKPE